jgi:hypothetical protein
MAAAKLQTKKENIIIKPNLYYFNVLDNSQVIDIIIKGYAKIKTVPDKHFSNLRKS